MRISKGSKRRAERTAEVKATDWNTYSIHDRKRVWNLLTAMHAVSRDATGNGAIKESLESAVARNERRYRRFCGIVHSKHMPHQGAKECARRVRQGVNYGL